MTLNGVMAVTLRYFTEFGKPVFQPRRSVHGRIYARVYYKGWPKKLHSFLVRLWRRNIAENSNRLAE